jgi:hypothetical protein
MAREPQSDGREPSLKMRIGSIQRLWHELQQTRYGSSEYKEIEASIQQEARAYIAALGDRPKR